MADGDRYALGQPVRVTGFVTRARLSNRRWWARTAITDPERQSGIVIGRRTLSDGTVDQEYDNDFYGMRVVSTVYHAEAYFPGWLVVRDIREKPIMVLDDDIHAGGAQ